MLLLSDIKIGDFHPQASSPLSHERTPVESFGSKQHSFVTVTQEQVVVNGVAHVIGDIPATNGLVHVIDQMIPVRKRLINLNTV